MPRKFFKRILPDPVKIKENRYLALLGDSIHESELWHLTKCSVAGAFFIGIFCAFLPIPFQSLLAATLAILFKRNLALSVALVFITNPITMPPIFYFNYWVGSLLLGDPAVYQQAQINDIWGWLTKNFDIIGKPLILGSLISGLVFGYLSYLTIHWFWVWKVTTRWKIRKQLRKSKTRQLDRSKALLTKSSK